ncbi:stalk domain-containing protein [Paenibacillus methanolicus]|uniref:Copper amine oxidase-like protein n=1 Tax=Paenibacillus methanolicus TaxID=582686 RepID=A0A5S5CB88_9BACL|nr:stalk domain-containing protein [Paenibacillus methanolicus]TYP75772.1 copper amine oxidase-like protein [Paenibacillus methanolicus]
MLKRWAVLFTLACMVLGIMPVAADAASAKVVVQLSVGSGVVTINGATSAIQKPYQANGTTLVPLSVITKAFGAGLKLEKNKIITLTYNKTKVVLTIGSKTVQVNGKASAIAIAPTVVNNVTMVPLRVIAQAFGAAISTNGKQIIIVGTPAGVSSSAGGQEGSTGINVDAGKTSVGDSYFGWSMSYPSDLTMSFQTDNGDATVWSNISENASIIVNIAPIDQAYTKEEIRDFIFGMTPEDAFILEKKTITTGGAEFEKMVVKTRDGWFYEFRAIQQNNRIYIIAAGVKSATRDGLNKYQSVLDSFKLSFDASNASLKDITKVKDGYMVVADQDYGLTMQTPADWVRDDESPYPDFGNEDYSFTFRVYSAVSGQTLEQWVTKERTDLEAYFAANYIRNVSESTIEIGNGPARVLSFEYTYDQKEWFTNHEIYYIEDEHKYMASYFYPSNIAVAGDVLYKQIAPTLEIDTESVDANFSEIEDTSDSTATVTKTSRKYGYSITLPETWFGIEKDFEQSMVQYGTPYGIFVIDIADEGMSASDFSRVLPQYVANSSEMTSAGATVKDNTQFTVNGRTFYKIVIEVPRPDEDLNPYVSTYYVTEKNGKVAVMMTTIYMANDTPANREKIENVVKSFT